MARITKKERLKIQSVKNKVTVRIEDMARDGGFYGRGLSGEGYDGGYRDAITDLMLYLTSGASGGKNQHLWDDE